MFSILIFTVHLPIYAQVEIENLFESINWNNTEPEFILKFHNCIEKKKHEKWESENTTSDYQFKNIKLNGITIPKAPIRVNAETRKIFKINFFIFTNCKDVGLKNDMNVYLTKLYGEP